MPALLFGEIDGDRTPEAGSRKPLAIGHRSLRACHVNHKADVRIRIFA
jgi:hypothetical protein